MNLMCSLFGRIAKSSGDMGSSTFWTEQETLNRSETRIARLPPSFKVYEVAFVDGFTLHFGGVGSIIKYATDNLTPGKKISHQSRSVQIFRLEEMA